MANLPVRIPDALVQRWIHDEFRNAKVARATFAIVGVVNVGLAVLPIGMLRLVPAVITMFCAAMAWYGHRRAAHWQPFDQAAAGGYLKVTRLGMTLQLENAHNEWEGQLERLELTTLRLSEIEQAATKALPMARVVQR